MKELLRKYGHVWALGYAFIYMPWFLYLERSVTRDYAVMHVRLDDYIPFNEYFIIPYLLWFLYVSAAVLYFFFTDKVGYYRLCTFLFAGMTISLLICTFSPTVRICGWRWIRRKTSAVIWCPWCIRRILPPMCFLVFMLTIPWVFILL